MNYTKPSGLYKHLLYGKVCGSGIQEDFVVKVQGLSCVVRNRSGAAGSEAWGCGSGNAPNATAHSLTEAVQHARFLPQADASISHSDG